MILHENRLADDSHEISCLVFFSKIGKDFAKNYHLSSAAVVIGALRVNIPPIFLSFCRNSKGCLVNSLTVIEYSSD